MKNKYIYIIVISFLFIFNINQVYGDNCKVKDDLKEYTENLSVNVNKVEDEDEEGNKTVTGTVTIDDIENDDDYVILLSNEKDIDGINEDSILHVFTEDDNEYDISEYSNKKVYIIVLYNSKNSDCDMFYRWRKINKLEDKKTWSGPDKVDLNTNARANFSSEEEKKLEDGGSNLYKSEQIIDEYTVTVPVRAYGSCKSNSGDAKVKVKFTQNISYKFNISTFSLYSGGGVGFSIDYINKLSWETTNIECSKIPVLNIGNDGCVEAKVYSEDCTISNEISKKAFDKVKNKIDSAIKQNISSNDAITIEFNDEKPSKGVNKVIESQVCTGKTNSRGTYLKDNECDDGDDLKVLTTLNGNLITYAKSNGYKQTIMKVELPNAYINRKNGKIKYASVGSTLGDDAKKDYIDAGKKYFLALDYNEDSFKIKSEIENISLLEKGKKVSASYSSKLNVEHKYYNVTNHKTNGYAFTYRTIDTSNVFPNYDAGDNWIDYLRNLEYYVSLNNNKIIANEASTLNNYMQDKTKETNTIEMTESEKPEYSIDVNDKTINDIKEYNKLNDYDNYAELNNDGTSTFVDRYFKVKTNHNKLGCGYYYNGIDKEGDCE